MKCNVKECMKKNAPVVGDCKFCGKMFCLNHRLVETHQCSLIESCRQQAIAKNTNALLKNKCISIKIDTI